jgi:predicted RecA/RadA family phage recombinase
MSTATNLQSLNDSTQGAGVSSSNRRQIETFLASNAIAAGDLVCFDITKTADSDKCLFVTPSDTASGNTIVCVGFALADASAGDKVDVTVAGLHESANVDAATAAGDRLIASNVAGRAALFTGAESLPVIAYAIEADTANFAGVIVIKQF